MIFSPRATGSLTTKRSSRPRASTGRSSRRSWWALGTYRFASAAGVPRACPCSEPWSNLARSRRTTKHSHASRRLRRTSPSGAHLGCTDERIACRTAGTHSAGPSSAIASNVSQPRGLERTSGSLEEACGRCIDGEKKRGRADSHGTRGSVVAGSNTIHARRSPTADAHPTRRRSRGRAVTAPTGPAAGSGSVRLCSERAISWRKAPVA